MRRIWWATISSILAGATLASLLWLIAWIHHFEVDAEPFLPPSMTTTSCGWTYDMAVANNCKFQLWSYSWVPPDCFDEKLNDDFLSLHEEEGWGYYSSGVEVPLESVLLGNRNDLMSTWGQHFWHCAFYQRKFFRVVEDNGGERTSVLKMTNRDLEEHHGIHCQEWLSNPKRYPWDKVNINLTVGYHFCS
ncbi:uncharacterized protein LY89DRAFT_572672 [Mollisia scopiformis]|uniref:Uncharacterized protein n=1 Tax=Mollisia scopiformis TaxID=149040 RepID=A0A194XVE8_MOLSC|nr:uncharacterized protein LY89DRAFT_572672 [Mollisia scopiformis]KUJ23687.1 hypothetical protein LY89DRAFT_572672 [Mollisia scopiformis]